MENRLIFSEINGINMLISLFGLVFPETATEFQKAALTMAYIVASFRDNILKGNEIPHEHIAVADQLWLIVMDNEYKQR